MNERFAAIAARIADWSGRWFAFAAALGVVVVWAVTGPLFHFSDTWQLVINTGTTVVTFLLAFLIQFAQNISATATQLKLDEIIRALGDARNDFIELQNASPARIAEAESEMLSLVEEERA